MSQNLTLRLRRQELEQDQEGYRVWQTHEHAVNLAAKETALVLCDVWDRHWCRGADERLAKLLPRMNAVVRAARARGVLIVHAPSDTIDFYRDSPARQRVLAALGATPQEELPHADPPLPIDAADGGCDTDDNVAGVDEKAWRRQHPAIEIDPDRDAISDDGRELYSLYRQRGIQNLLIMGVHTNMCVLNRSFAIKQMVRWGFNVALIRDLTDCMYNPARPPYVSHDEGLGLTLAYIEKFWCPTLSSEDLL